MHRRLLKTLLPLFLLGSSACLDIPELETPGTQQPAGRFSLSIDPGHVTVLQGGSRSLQLSLTRAEDFTDSVTVQLVNPPAGISAQPVTIAAGSSSATLSVSANSSAEPGPRTLTVRGTAGTLSWDTTVTLTVARQGDVVVQWASPSQSKAYAKDSIQVQVVVEGGMADTIDLYKGTDLLTRLAGPSYQYTWDTSQEAEGEYPLTARATVGGITFNSAIRTIVVDHTAPTVATRTPAPGATSVSVRDPLQVSFDEALKATSVTDASVVLSTAGTSNITKTLSLSADGKTLTISPSTPLPQAEVTVTLGTPTAPLTDLAGNALAPSSTWSFTLPAWLPLGGAISAAPGTTAAENVTMKVGTDGNPVIAWSESDGTTKNIYVRRWDGTNWQPIGNALSATSGTGTHADRPALLLDTQNRPIIVWDENLNNASPFHIHGSRWTGTVWEALPAFTRAPDESRVNASIALDKTGSILVSVNEILNGNQAVGIYRLAPSSSAWESESNSLPSYSQPLLTEFATDALGNWFITLNSVDSDGVKDYRSLPVLKKTPSSTWTPQGAPLISPAKNYCVAASLVVGGDNQPRIAWEESDTSTTSSIHAAYYDGSSWKMYNDTVHTGTTSNKTPSLVMGHDGNPMVAWSGYASPEQSIWVRRWTGSTWQQMGSRLSAVTGPTTSGFQPVLALDKNGQPLVAWHESDGTVSNIYVYRYNY